MIDEFIGFFAAYIMLPPRCSCSLFIAHAEAARVRICPLFRPHFTTSPTPTLLSPRNNRSLNTCGKSTNSPLKNLFPFFASPPVGAAQIQNRSSACTCLCLVTKVEKDYVPVTRLGVPFPTIEVTDRLVI